MRTVLILAYYFPPMGLGGVQRVLKFVRYLPACGWRPVVVTVREVCYYDEDPSLLDEVPLEALVLRTGSLDPLRIAYRLGLRPQYATDSRAQGSILRRICFPDNQAGWIPFAVMRALRVMRHERVDAIFSTFPPASGHLAAWTLHRLTGLPWVADFRDGWADGEFIQGQGALRQFLTRRLQAAFARRAAHLTAVSEEIAGGLKTSDSAVPVTVLPNGYDPDDFTGIPPLPETKRFVLTYAGALNAARNPEPLFQALRRLFDRQPGRAERIEVRLAGAVIGLDIGRMVQQYGLQGVVRPLGYLPHRDALAQILAADALALLITSGAHPAAGVPTGKIYEYLASGRPVLGIAPAGAASDLLRRFGRGATVAPHDIDGIARLIGTWMDEHETGALPVYPVNDEAVRLFSRPYLTHQLARILDHVVTA
jgi:glycosyltransferase involved in cell wall biosynthesis